MVIRIVMTSSVSSSAKNILYKNAPADSLEIGLHKLKLVKHSQHSVFRNKIIERYKNYTGSTNYNCYWQPIITFQHYINLNDYEMRSVLS